MLQSFKACAPAKINLHLRVHPKRPDCFHDIESIFQKISLFDDLFIECIEKTYTCEVICNAMKLPLENTLTATYREFANATGVTVGVRLELEKRIPSGAGLGGGSSDAAAFLEALNEMFETKLTQCQKNAIAEKVGSDVSFFLSPHVAVVTGRGEKVREIPQRSDLFFVLVCPEVHSSTKEAYALVDDWLLENCQQEEPSLENLESMYFDDVRKWTFFNTFSEPLVRRFGEIGQALIDLEKSGALFTRMSGSGSSVFGVFISEKEAQNAAQTIGRTWKRCYVLSSM